MDNTLICVCQLLGHYLCIVGGNTETGVHLK